MFNVDNINLPFSNLDGPTIIAGYGYMKPKYDKGNKYCLATKVELKTRWEICRYYKLQTKY